MKTSKRESAEAKGYLERNGYKVSTHESGRLIVQDPVMRCGSETLIPAGSVPVNIRDFASAIRFVQERS